MRICRLAGRLLIAAAIAAVALSLAAGSVGIDRDGKWGPFRIGLLATGLIVLMATAVLRGIDRLDDRILKSREQAPDTDDAAVRGLDKQEARPSAVVAWRSTIRLLTLATFLLLMELAYVWYASASLMTRLPETTSFYPLLAEAFAHGRTDLLIEPPSELLELEDPYNPATRPGLRVLGDASYFRGRYFAYWGPAPTLFVFLLSLFGVEPVGDQHVAVVAATILLLFTFLTLLYLKREYFSHLPWWLGALALAIGALGHPTPWVLSSPAVWQTAVLSGQAFLIAGLFFALPLIEGRESRACRSVMAGTMWGLAIASRLILLFPATVLAAAGVAGALRSSRGGWRGPASRTAAVFTPIVVTLAILGWYNYERFGNVLQTGIQYQLTSNLDHKGVLESEQFFHPAYLPTNVLYYSVTPVRIEGVFPFVRPVRGEWPALKMFLRNFPPLQPYGVEAITGIAFAMPFALFAGGLIGTILCRPTPVRTGHLPGRSMRQSEQEVSLRRVGVAMLLASTASLGLLLVYRWSASRFMLDFMPMLAMSSVLGAFLLFEANRHRPIRGRLMSFVILGLALCSLVVSLLLAVTGPASVIDDYNPVLWRALTQLRLW